MDGLSNDDYIMKVKKSFSGSFPGLPAATPAAITQLEIRSLYLLPFLYFRNINFGLQLFKAVFQSVVNYWSYTDFFKLHEILQWLVLLYVQYVCNSQGNLTKGLLLDH